MVLGFVLSRTLLFRHFYYGLNKGLACRTGKEDTWVGGGGGSGDGALMHQRRPPSGTLASTCAMDGWIIHAYKPPHVGGKAEESWRPWSAPFFPFSLLPSPFLPP